MASWMDSGSGKGEERRARKSEGVREIIEKKRWRGKKGKEEGVGWRGGKRQLETKR